MRILGVLIACTITGACVVGALHFASAVKDELEKLY